MANYSHLLGCPTIAAGSGKERENIIGQWPNPKVLPQAGGDWGPDLSAKYCVPLFWIGGFTPDDVVPLSATFSDIAGEKSEWRFSGLCADVRNVRDRLLVRKQGLMRLLPKGLQESYDEFYDQWTDYLAARFSNAIVLDASDCFAMIGLEEGSALLEAAVSSIAVLDSGHSITDVSSFERLSAIPDFGFLNPDKDAGFVADGWRAQLAGSDATGGTVLPPDSSDLEIAFANSQSSISSDHTDHPGPRRNPERPKRWWKIW